MEIYVWIVDWRQLNIPTFSTALSDISKGQTLDNLNGSLNYMDQSVTSSPGPDIQLSMVQGWHMLGDMLICDMICCVISEIMLYLLSWSVSPFTWHWHAMLYYSLRSRTVAVSVGQLFNSALFWLLWDEFVLDITNQVRSGCGNGLLKHRPKLLITIFIKTK